MRLPYVFEQQSTGDAICAESPETLLKTAFSETAI
jgi:hypothetical protein